MLGRLHSESVLLLVLAMKAFLLAPSKTPELNAYFRTVRRLTDMQDRLDAPHESFPIPRSTPGTFHPTRGE